MVSGALRNLYWTSFSQAASLEAGLLAVGNNEGRIVVFDLGHVVSGREGGSSEHLQTPCRVINAHTDAVYAMVATEGFCVSGATGQISGRRWDDLKDREQSHPAWNLSLECDQANFGTPEVNSLAHDHHRGLLYAACGDWRTHVYDLETGKRTHTLEGHEDYVHKVVVDASGGSLVASAGEDGRVLVWDPRVGREPRHRLTPHTHTELARPSLGKFVATLDITGDDWLVCGGGPRAGIFHLKTLALTTVLPPTDNPSPSSSSSTAITVTKFTRHADGGDRGGIVVAGLSPQLTVCSMAGVVTGELPCSSPCIYTVNVTDKPFTMMTYGGTSTKLDVCYNLNYRHHTVSLLEETTTITK